MAYFTYDEWKSISKYNGKFVSDDEVHAQLNKIKFTNHDEQIIKNLADDEFFILKYIVLFIIKIVEFISI